MVKTDVLLATYNGEKYLPELLDSLRRQTEAGFRVLCQDDGSTDGTAGILASVFSLDSRFVPVSGQGLHLGPVGNFLSLLARSDADYIFFCDQDDIWEADKIQFQMEAMQNAEHLWGTETPLLIHSDCSLIGENGQETAPSFFRLQGWDPGAVTLPPLLVQNNVTGCTMMLNRSLAQLVIRYGRAENMFMHDWFIALTAAAFGRIVFLDRPLTRYRQHSGNAVGASRSSLLRRGGEALRSRQKSVDRIQLTYSHTASFLNAYGTALPASAEKTVRDYLATRSMPKLSRILAVHRQGCVMQSPVTRMGQILFG